MMTAYRLMHLFSFCDQLMFKTVLSYTLFGRSLYLCLTNMTPCCLLHEGEHFREGYCLRIQDRNVMMLDIFSYLENVFRILMRTCVQLILKFFNFKTTVE
jgi:hypothetical protein